MTKNHECPYCGDSNVRRIKRRSWMRMIPTSELFDCHNCNSEYLMIFDMIKIKSYKGNLQLTTH